MYELQWSADKRRRWRHGADTAIESADEGVDSVESSVDLALGDNVENLSLIDDAINGTGNALDKRVGVDLSFLSVTFLQPARYARRSPMPLLLSRVSRTESRRWRYGDIRGIGLAGNDAVFEMRRKA